MALRRGKKKRPSREKHMFKEQLKIEEGVFDERAMRNISSLFTHHIVSKMQFIIAKGKEADVYLADSGTKIEDSDLVVMKIFRVETSSFLKRIDYIVGDPRFEKLKNNIYSIVKEWCKKEYGNLKIAKQAGIHAPVPYGFFGTVLAESFIGENGVPAGTLKDFGTKEPEKTLDIIIDDVKKLYENELVHGDLSEYNILMKSSTPYIIDFGQAVVLRHHNAMNFLRRDVSNILSYFSKKYGIDRNPEEVFDYITGKR